MRSVTLLPHTIALPQLPDGRTYISREMMENYPEVLAFYERTKNSWYQDENREIVVLYPSIERKQRFVEVPE